MKIKNLVAYAAIALGVVAAPFVGHAAVSGGDIYSVDLVSDYGGVIPAPGTTLTIGEKVTVRIRLINRDDETSGKPTDWRFAPNWPSGQTAPEDSAFGPQLGLMLGGQQVFAGYMGSKQVPVGTSSPVNQFTDLYFQYTTKSGDLALPARFMSIAGKAVGGDDDATDYAIQYCNFYGSYWKLTNNNGNACVFHFCDENLDPNPDPTWSAGEPHRFIDGSGLGINVKTVDFDTNYFKEPSAPGVDDGIWRQIDRGSTRALPAVPTVKVDGYADVAATMYVWVENPDPENPVAQVRAADNPELIDGRWVIKVPVAKGAQTATFYLQGMANGEAKVRMSASRELSYSGAGDLLEDWVERIVRVVDPPEPFVQVETLNMAGEPQTEFTCSTNYMSPVGMFRITLSQSSASKVTATLVPGEDIIPENVNERRIGLSASSEKADMPWLDRTLSVDFEPGETMKTLYIYALDRTSDYDGKIEFKPVLSGAGAAEYTGEPISGFIFVNGFAPVVTSPRAGDALDPAMLGVTYTLDVAVDDSYRNLRQEGEWAVKIRSNALGDTKWHDFPDLTVDLDFGNTISVDIDFEQLGEDQTLEFKVVDPDGVSSDSVKTTISVSEGKVANATPDRGADEYAESGELVAKVYFSLTSPNGKNVYAFLNPLNDDAKTKVSSPQLAATGNNGVLITAGKTDSETRCATVTLLDGDASALFEVVLCSQQAYASGKKVTSYTSGQCTINITNVVPVINSAAMGGQTVKVNGGVAKTVAQGVAKKFTISVSEPGQLDLDATGEDVFRTQWKFGTSDWEDMDGNPNKTNILHTFTSPGDQEVTVRCQDKDMRKLGKWSEEFTFTVPVLDIPRVIVKPVQDRSQYYEDETGIDSAFEVSLSAAPDINDSTSRLHVKLTVIDNSTKMEVADPTLIELSRDRVEFSSGVSSGPTFFLSSLDGTAKSSTKGYTIRAEVTNAVVDVEGKTWDMGETEVYILNREPSILNPAEKLDKDNKPIATTTTVGVPNTLAWSIRDVEADQKGMSVTWETSEGARKTYKQGEDAEDVMTGTHEFSFSSAGEKSITMTALDKDGGSVSRTFYYTIDPSKALMLVPHGPSAGKNTPLSKRYRTAAGLGEGRVWAKNVSTVEGFQGSYNCGLEKTWTIYGYGYKVGEESGAVKKYANREHKLDAEGNLSEAGGYVYADPLKDSFLYAWIQIYRKGGSGSDAGSVFESSYLNGTTSPEYPETTDVGAEVALPDEAGEDKLYDNTIVEAVFSKEYLPSDNVGDINQDAIPDVVVDKYGLGVVDTALGTLTGDDLKKANGFNEDEDFLPSTETSRYGSIIPELPENWTTLGKAFDAKTEIRGYHEGLNDALEQMGITGVKPDRIYEMPDGSYNAATCTISRLEYLAWKKSGLPADQWSPERPTDPMVADTDEDGFDDGFEYFFWYRAHVGYLENEGTADERHCYMTGRRYVPMTPGEPEIISSDEIAKLMDPLVASGDASGAETRDTDNDGLPDLLEFELGTNPFDFDTDGDGLPDGYEVMLGGKEAGFDPLLWSTAKNAHGDGELNADGDAMATCTWGGMSVASTITKDGVIVRYAAEGQDVFTTRLSETAAGAGTLIRVISADGSSTNLYVTTAAVTTNFVEGAAVLTCDIGKDDAWTAYTKEDGTLVRGTPVALFHGMEISELVEGQEYFDEILTAVPATSWTTWIYGVGGELALGREVEKGGLSNRVVRAVEGGQSVRCTHYQVYRKLGFDPRTAWKRPPGEDNCVDTRLYTALDEFLFMGLLYQDGMLAAGDITPTRARPMQDIWAMYTTDPTKADTDDDGMPDGWEAYVMAGPKKGVGTTSAGVWIYSPIEPFGDIANDTARDNDGDGLEWPYEFSGTESSAEYSEICATIENLRPEWRNKKWPTDPWATDTDGDGLGDGMEGQHFIYGDPEATGEAGGGLNPCSWDTDCDGLPDPFEVEFKGTYTEGKATEETTTSVAPDGTTNTTVSVARESGTWSGGMDGTVDDARLDYDHDGLCNWQEYMAGAVRAWRYDDTVSTWSNLYVYSVDELPTAPSPSDREAWGKFWGDRLLNPLSGTYNPQFVSGMFDGVQSYFSCATNKFERKEVFHRFYMFKDGIYHDLVNPTDPRYRVGDKWCNRFTFGKSSMYYKTYLPGGDMPIYPTKYICCDPTKADTDYDGMDDYYEVFHGLNPLLGERDQPLRSDEMPYDLIYESYGGLEVKPWSAANNYWTENLKPNTKYEGMLMDFEVFPWLAGEAHADPDGDNIPNQQESILPNVQAASTYLHTDPTPLWMTDSDYALSIPRRYYLPGYAYVSIVDVDGPTFIYEGKEHRWDELPWITYQEKDGRCWFTVNYDFNAGRWAFGVNDYHFSFEENEGYDTDHDYLSDFEEAQGKTKSASDPQNFDDPLRRQAMYFNGEDAFLQTPLPTEEWTATPAGAAEQHQNFLYYTVECWAKADAASIAADNMTRVVVERAIVTGEENPADESYLRKNFQLGVRNGLWYTKFDSTGTDKKQAEEITDGPAATTEWTHLAATYDGTALRLYVNGICSNVKATKVQPEHGVCAISVNPAGEIGRGKILFNTISILVGAGAKDTLGVIFDPAYRGFLGKTTRDNYTGFFKGYVDELSIWDGARPASDIRSDYETRKRLTREDALENRQVVYSNWRTGARRSPVSEVQLPPQLMYHWSFDHVAGAIRPEDVAKVPAGFDTAKNVVDAKAIWSRPDGWYSYWLRNYIDGSIKSKVFTDDSWIPWIADTVGHLPRFDGTTLDSVYWSQDFAGATPAADHGYPSFAFPQSAEPYSRWQQQTYNIEHQGYSRTQRTRWDVVNGDEANSEELAEMYRFTLRDRNTVGFDLLPFGGAYPRRISASEGGMWDRQGASDAWAQNGRDSDNSGLPDWWTVYARNNYCADLDPLAVLGWDTPVNYHGITLRAWQAYIRDLARGMVKDGDTVRIDPDYADTRDIDADGLPDWWEEMYGVQGYSQADADADPDNDGLSNYAEYLLGEVYPFDETIGPQLASANLRLLNPTLAHSVTNQLVTDYFLKYADAFQDVKNAEGKSAFFLNEYFGEIATDHDFMENWWENKLASAYANSRVYDPLDDKDEDGWSNWAECRATLWGGHFDASLIDRWTGSDSSQSVVCYPEPIIGVRATYNGKQPVSGCPLVIRVTTGQTPRTDATFVIPAELDSQTRYIGPFMADYTLHGHMSPGHVNGNSIIFQRAKVSSDKTYVWNCDWYKENEAGGMGWGGGKLKNNGDNTWANCDRTHTGSFEAFRSESLKWPKLELEGGDLTWEAFTESFENGDVADIFASGVKLGTANITTGEYELDLSKFDGDVSTYVFRVTYTSRIGHEWPQTVYVSDTKELASGAGEGIAGQGRVREGRNTIEAFMDLDGDGLYTAGEPFGTARNVQIGWHKVPEVVIELKDESPIMPCVAVGSSASAAAEEGGDSTDAAGLTKTVRVIRESINGIARNERTLATKEVVLDDHPYLTEADVSTSAKPDLDWTWLLKDAAKIGLGASEIAFAGYRVDEVRTLSDGSVTNIPLAVFSKQFPAVRPMAKAVEPIDGTPVYSASPTLTFSISDALATGYRLQIRKRGETELVYDSGVALLPGRTGSTVGAPVCAVTVPVYAGAPVYAGITTNRAVFADATAYQWRVALYDAKYNATTDNGDTSPEWSGWSAFEMDIANANRYPKFPTGYGSATLAVRYYGPNTNDLAGTVVVEAFENADFRGQPLAQLRLTNVTDLASIADISTPNAVLRGLKPGKVFFRAYVDQNNNGSRDRWESWGYVNMVGSGFRAIYNPEAMDITVSTADWVIGETADRVIYIEDCDVNKNENPDCLEPNLFPDTAENSEDVVTEPWWAWAEADPEDFEEGDVMAFRWIAMRLVTVVSNDLSRTYLLPLTNAAPVAGNSAAGMDFYTYYMYGEATYGLGTNVTESLEGWKIYEGMEPTDTPKTVPVLLVHNQVYENCGFCIDTAVPWGRTDTRPFTAEDKYWVLRYLESTGRLPAGAVNPYPDKYPTFADYVMNSGDPKLYEKWTLKPGELDMDHDGIADGWELYVGANPLDFTDREKETDGDGLKLWEEYNKGARPTDPANRYSMYEALSGYGLLLPGTEKFDDTVARRFRFPADEKDQDGDIDLISNIDEMRAYYRDPAALADLSVSNAWSNGETPDYFRACGDSYLGALFNGAEFIETDWRDLLGLGDKSRWGTRTFMVSGWDYWSIVRNSDGGSASAKDDGDLAFVLNYLDAVVPGECTAKTLPELREFVHQKWNGVERDVRQGDYWNEDYNYSYVYDEATGTYHYQTDSDDDDSVTWMTLTGDKLVTLEEMIQFFGGRKMMNQTIAKNLKDDSEDDIVIPTPLMNLKLKYAGDYKCVVLVEAYQVNPVYPEYGEQRTAFWNVSAEFSAGVASPTLESPNAGSLKQGPARFVAYIDVDGDGKLSPGDTFGMATVNVGYLGADVEIRLGDANPALPVIDLSSVSNGLNGVAIVRVAVNGVPLERPQGVWFRYFGNNVDRGVLHPFDFVSKDFIGIDKGLEALDGDILSVEYAVLAGERPFHLADIDSNNTFTVSYSTRRDQATALALASSLTNNATLSFRVDENCQSVTKFWVKANGEIYGGARGFLLPNAADGTVTIDLAAFGIPVKVGEDNVFAVALGNDRFGYPEADGDFCESATFAVNEAQAWKGAIVVDIEHPVTNFTNGVTVAVYEKADLANPFRVVTNEATGAAVTIDGLREGARYYVAAWYVKDAEDGRADASERKPYDTWGYLTMLGEAANGFDVKAVKAVDPANRMVDVPMVTNLVFLQDTDWNDNGILDREEDFKAINGAMRGNETPVGNFDFDEFPIDELDPDPVFPEEESDEDEGKYIARGDVMAYADVPVWFVWIGDDLSSAVRYVIMDIDGEGVKLRDSDIPLQTDATNLQWVATTYDYGKFVGLGTNVTLTAGKVLATECGTVRLVHAQVYAQYGFETGCAAISLNEGNDPRFVEGISAAEHPHTKAFTRLDKYLVVRYLQAIGVEGFNEAELLENPDDEVWTLVRRNVRDSDLDSVADGWELYVMFGGTREHLTKESLPISPWNTADGMLVAPGAGSQLKLVEEFDGGCYATDPWNVDTDRDGVIDFYAYQYHLKGGEAGMDFDDDGLSNYAEYLISEVFRYAKLDPENPKTDGYCVDYFRKMGDLYLGEIFTDHDQVDDVWEGGYPTAANRYVYDPSRDDDKDGWSNYAEFRAGTDPSKGAALGVSGADGKIYTKSEYPVPVIEANVVYNGNAVNLGSLVFMAWNETSDPDMTSAPDAIWTFGNGEAGDDESAEAETGSTAQSKQKYIGRNPSGVQRYMLAGGSVLRGTVAVKFLDQGYVRDTTAATAAKNARWYVGVTDRDGSLVDFRGETVGTVDYDTGLMTLDCSKLAGSAIGVANSTDGKDMLVPDTSAIGTTFQSSYDRISLADADMLVAWDVVYVGFSPNGVHYLADADPVAAGVESHGHVREGLNTFYCFVDGDSDGRFTPGEPFGVVRGVDVGWQGASFTVELSETSPISDRIDLMDNTDDRAVSIQGALTALINDRTTTNDAQRAGLLSRIEVVNLADSLNSRIRVVRYGIDDMFCYSVGVGEDGVNQRIVMEKEFDMDGRDFVNEADFLGADAFDIDWGTMTDEIVDASGNPIAGVSLANLSVTNMTYLVVVGDGKKDFRTSDDTNTVQIAGLITRRFDAKWTAPRCEGVIGGGDLNPAGVVYTAHPTFVWSMPLESKWASRFGSSYTAFELRIFDRDTDALVYTSGIVRAPATDALGRFVWTAPISVGDQTPEGKIFKNAANYYWDVAMFNAKFQSRANPARSESKDFSTSVNTQQPQNDAGFSSIGVTVKYTGPSKVLEKCASVTDVQGKVRVQAFTTADFSGVPAAETFVASRTALTDAADVLTNACLKGLAAGTYHIRAYIDMNGNFVKDDFESWGCAKEPVTVGPEVERMPAVGLYIEDADTNGNWYPDAWEYVEYGKWAKTWDAVSKYAPDVEPGGKIVLSTAVYDSMTSGVAGFSTGLGGAKITVFQDSGFAKLILKSYLGDDLTYTTFDAIRKAVEKKIGDKTLKITAITFDTENSKVVLAIDAETDYANLVAGNFATRLYDLDAMGIDATCTVTVQVYKKSTLAQEKWELVDTVENVKIGRGQAEVRVGVRDNGGKIDASSGFYMIKVVQ